MKKKLLVVTMLAAFTSLATMHFIVPGAAAPEPGAVPADTTCQCNNTFINVTYGPIVPGDAVTFGAQNNADCFAWAEFVSLNWPTKAGAGFGDPGDLSAVQWETYIQKEALFPPNGAHPGPWSSKSINAAEYSKDLIAHHLNGNTKLLKFGSKFDEIDLANFDSSNSGQAAPFNAPSWLGAQNGTNVWYEVRLNKDIYDYVVANKYYNANNQAADAQKGVPINFPKGVLNGITGAIELKAAWMEVKDTTDPKWRRYKLSRSVVQDLNTGKLRPVIVALVGLHILHKTTKQPSWVWATFEQVDNVPNMTDTTYARRGYNFFNPNCKNVTFPVAPQYLATGATSPVTINCDSINVPPAYYLKLGGPGPKPNNVKRLTPIDANAAKTNDFMQKQIKSLYPNSVWQYYELVNVVWSSNPRGVTDTTSNLPFKLNGMLPNVPVANSTMESYIQQNTCTYCHTFSSIAETKNTNVPSYFGDFSFAIGTATYPGVPARIHEMLKNSRRHDHK